MLGDRHAEERRELRPAVARRDVEIEEVRRAISEVRAHALVVLAAHAREPLFPELVAAVHRGAEEAADFHVHAVLFALAGLPRVAARPVALAAREPRGLVARRQHELRAGMSRVELVE